MSKSTNKLVAILVEKRAKASKPAKPTAIIRTKSLSAVSKQARVIAMLQSPAGTTIAAMMKETGWQQHSVRGFLAGVLRKKLKLKLVSKTVDGKRIYRITGGTKVDHQTTKHLAA